MGSSNYETTRQRKAHIPTMIPRGFLLAGPALYAAIAAGAVVVGLSVAVKIQTSRLDACKAEFGAFRMETKRIGEAADADRKRINAENLKAKEKADAQLKAVRAANANLTQRLRDERSSGRALSAVPADPASPATACFDREKLERAISGFVEGAATLVGRGQQAVEELESAREWAANVAAQ